MEPAKERDATGRGSLAVVGEPVFALVRRFVSRSARACWKGRCQAGALRRRFRGDAKQMGSETIEFIESRLKGKFQLEINREKTRVVDLREEGASLDFLGYTFRYDRDLKGRDGKYLNVFPSKKAVQRERAKLHEMTDSHQCFKPIPSLIGELNRH